VQQFRLGSFAFWTSVLFTTLLYMQSLKEDSAFAGFLYTGDVVNLWLPALMHSFAHTADFNFWGLDYGTTGGSSEFFLRPNLPTHNPFILLASLLFDLKEPKEFFKIFVWLLFIHSLVSCYFTQKLCVRFFGFDRYLALFVAVGYAFSFYMVWILGFPPFIMIGLLFPVIIYCGLASAALFSPRMALAYSFPIFLMFTGGYIALSVAGVFFAALFVVIYLLYVQPLKPFDYRTEYKNAFILLLKAMAPFIIASIVALPFYLAIVDFYHDAGSSLNLFGAAHQLAEKPHQILRLFSPGLVYIGTFYELNIAWGLIPVCIFALFLFVTKGRDDFAAADFRLLQVSAVFYFIIMLSIFGDFSPLSDVFYHLLPGIGSMHIYQRYLIMFQLFLMLLIALTFHVVLHKDSVRSYKLVFAIAFGILMIAAHYTFYGRKGAELPIVDDRTVFDLILLCLFVLSLIICKRNMAVVVATVFMFLVPLNIMYDFSSGQSWQVPAERGKQSIVFQDAENAKLIAYFKANSQKNKIKFINLVPDYHTSYVPKNYAWFVKDKVNLSGYNGYEPHLGTPLAYRAKMVSTIIAPATKWHFIPDWDWMKRTGAEFVIYKDGEASNDKTLLQYADLSDPKKMLDLPQGIKVAPLKFEKTYARPVVFDNGYIRVYSDDANTTVSAFKANDATYMKFKVTSSTPSEVDYLFWANDKLRLEVNGDRQEFINTNGLLSVQLKAGDNDVSITYKNFKMLIFMIFYVLYILAFVLFVVGSVRLFIKRRLT